MNIKEFQELLGLCTKTKLGRTRILIAPAQPTAPATSSKPIDVGDRRNQKPNRKNK
jgi:hypothetical protein